MRSPPPSARSAITLRAPDGRAIGRGIGPWARGPGLASDRCRGRRRFRWGRAGASRDRRISPPLQEVFARHASGFVARPTGVELADARRIRIRTAELGCALTARGSFAAPISRQWRGPERPPPGARKRAAPGRPTRGAAGDVGALPLQRERRRRTRRRCPARPPRVRRRARRRHQ